MLLQHDVAKANQIGIHHDTLIPTQEGWIDSHCLDDFVDAAQLHQNRHYSCTQEETDPVKMTIAGELDRGYTTK
jgi:hypothetical protein